MITRRDFLQGTAAGAMASALGLGRGLADSDRQPRCRNVLLIMADDLCANLGCYGSADILSPHLDRLARRGVRFEHNYCQYPVCNPSRSSLLTSLRPSATGIVTNSPDDSIRRRLQSVVTLPELFRRNGYYTSSQGKISHTGVDAAGRPRFEHDPKSWERRNDESGVEEQGAKAGKGSGESYTALLDDPEQSDWCRWFAGDWADEEQTDGKIASRAIREIEEHKDKPFFIAVGFNKPHDAYFAPKAYFEQYPLDRVVLPLVPPDRSPEVPLAFERATWFNGFGNAQRRLLKRAYCAAASYTDAQIGRVLGALDRHRLWDDTIVVFLADHGYQLWEHGWLGKNTLFENSARVPLIVWAPGRLGMGRSAPGIVESLDLYPTLAELCGLTAPTAVQGESFGRLLDDVAAPGKDCAYTVIDTDTVKIGNSLRSGKSVRAARWRYSEWVDGSAELYDQIADPKNYYNLAEKAEHREVRRALGGRLAGIPLMGRA